MRNITTIMPSAITPDHILSSRANLDLIHIPNFFKSSAKWEEFIKHADFLIKRDDLVMSSPVKTINSLQIWGDLFHAGYYLENSKAFAQLDELKEKTAALYGRYPDNGCTLVNFVGMQKMIPIHEDIRDSFYVQFINSVEWRVYESSEDDTNYQSLLVNEGDALFVPKGLIHSVFCKDPRAAVSLFYNHN